MPSACCCWRLAILSPIGSLDTGLPLGTLLAWYHRALSVAEAPEEIRASLPQHHHPDFLLWLQAPRPPISSVSSHTPVNR